MFSKQYVQNCYLKEKHFFNHRKRNVIEKEVNDGIQL